MLSLFKLFDFLLPTEEESHPSESRYLGKPLLQQVDSLFPLLARLTKNHPQARELQLEIESLSRAVDVEYAHVSLNTDIIDVLDEATMFEIRSCGISRAERRKISSNMGKQKRKYLGKLNSIPTLETKYILLKKRIEKLIREEDSSQSKKVVATVSGATRTIQGTSVPSLHLQPSRQESITRSANKLSKIAARLETIQGTGRFQVEELDKMRGDLMDLKMHGVTELESQKQTLVELIDQIKTQSLQNSLNGESADSKLEEGVVPTSEQARDTNIKKESLSDAEMQYIKEYFSRLRVHLGIPSSTNHSKKGSTADGSFTLNALKPLFNIIEQLYLSEGIRYTNFTLADVANQIRIQVDYDRSGNSFKHLMQILSKYHEPISMNTLHHAFARVLEGMQGNGLFADNAFLILIDKLKNFNPPPIR